MFSAHRKRKKRGRMLLRKIKKNGEIDMLADGSHNSLLLLDYKTEHFSAFPVSRHLIVDHVKQVGNFILEDGLMQMFGIKGYPEGCEDEEGLSDDYGMLYGVLQSITRPVYVDAPPPLKKYLRKLGFRDTDKLDPLTPYNYNMQLTGEARIPEVLQRYA